MKTMKVPCRRAIRLPALATLLALALAGPTGCYRHVVGARGPGAENYEVHEASIGEDESVWSTPRPKVKEPNRAVGTTGSAIGTTRPAALED